MQLNHEELAFLKIRANVALDGDIQLAENEVISLFDAVKRVQIVSELPKEWMWASKYFTGAKRKNSLMGFLCSKKKYSILDTVRKLSFIEEVWFDKCSADTISSQNYDWLTTITNCKGGQLECAIPLMAAAELLSKTKKIDTEQLNETNLVNLLITNEENGDIHDSLIDSKSKLTPSSIPHVHRLHKYKAKFFPRMIRSLLNTVSNDAPRMDGNHIMILDPFVGSGTTLVEAALLGCPSTGIDIDPLSCLISESKIYLLNSDFRDIRSACHSIIDLHKEINPNRENGTPYKFPKVISKKFDKWGTIEEKEAYENEIDTWRATISTIKEKRIRDLFFVCLSDSLTRKFNIRMMGTGVGRFALEISSKGITSMMYQNIEHLMRSSFTCNQLRIAYSLRLPSAEVKQGDARKMDVKDESKSIILTSPPYLPASSGRENYLTGKSISITALGLLDEKELLQYDENSLGSMKANSSANKDGIPEAVYDLFEWLKKDESRALKAEPILAYYQDIKAALEETYRVLMPGGLAIYVIGKESVFYQFSTRKVLRRVMCDQIFIELAKNAGFEVVKQIDIELDKRNRNARPRSKDSYFESAIIIKKPR